MSLVDNPDIQAIGLLLPNHLLFSYRKSRQLLGGVLKFTVALWVAEGPVEPVRIGLRRCFRNPKAFGDWPDVYQPSEAGCAMGTSKPRRTKKIKFHYSG